jgi:hypothetical protein
MLWGVRCVVPLRYTLKFPSVHYDLLVPPSYFVNDVVDNSDCSSSRSPTAA